MEDLIGYDAIIESSMRDVIKKILEKVAKSGLKGAHYFVITFSTKYEGVNVPKHLEEKFPEEMTIVVQYQFENLLIGKENFQIDLSFAGNMEKLKIPYNSITSFADPSINFGLKFSNYLIEDYDEQGGEESVKKGGKATKKQGKKLDLANNVISLDAFRKNKDKK